MTNTHEISPLERYKFVTSMIQYHNEKMIEAFKLFIQVLSAIVGGSVWLSNASGIYTRDTRYWLLADLLVICVAMMTAITVIANQIAWIKFRRAEHNLNQSAPKPGNFWSYWNELSMLLVVGAATLLFVVFNPL